MALTIKEEEKDKTNGKLYCTVCKCAISSSVDTPEQLKKKIEASGSHKHGK